MLSKRSLDSTMPTPHAMNLLPPAADWGTGVSSSRGRAPACREGRGATATRMSNVKLSARSLESTMWTPHALNLLPPWVDRERRVPSSQGTQWHRRTWQANLKQSTRSPESKMMTPQVSNPLPPSEDSGRGVPCSRRASFMWMRRQNDRGRVRCNELLPQDGDCAHFHLKYLAQIVGPR